MMVDAVVGGVTTTMSVHTPVPLMVLLIRRDEPPFEGWWALPGGHCKATESFEHAVRRELREETSVQNIYLEQFHTFSRPGRDPRGPTGSVGFFSLVNLLDVTLKAGSDAKEARWFPIDELPNRLAFDHAEILEMGIERLREATWKSPIFSRVLAPKFPMGQLHMIYEQVSGKPVNKANFRRDYLKLGFLEELEEVRTEVAHRPPKLYRFIKSLPEPV